MQRFAPLAPVLRTLSLLVVVALMFLASACTPTRHARPARPGPPSLAGADRRPLRHIEAEPAESMLRAHVTTQERIEERSPPEREADRVFREMHADFFRCYERRLKTYPNAHAFVTFDVLVGEDGLPREVTTTGGALLGQAARACIEERIRRGAFSPPPGGGTSRLRVPFAFHPDARPEDE